MQTNEIIKELIDKVNSYGEYEGQVNAVEAYNTKPENLPVSELYVSFCTNENEVTFFEDENEECCKRTTVQMKCDFLASTTKDSTEILKMAETIMDYLINQYAGKMKEYKIGAYAYDKDLRAMRLPCRLEFVYEQCPAYGKDSAVIKPFADFLCKTHVNDESVHVSPKEKDYWLEPFVFGTYVGDGEEENSVLLGFRPKFVLLFASGSAGVSIDGEKVISYFAFALKTKATKGIQLTADGFKVTQGVTVVAKKTYPHLNDFAQTYNYIAFK